MSNAAVKENEKKADLQLIVLTDQTSLSDKVCMCEICDNRILDCDKGEGVEIPEGFEIGFIVSAPEWRNKDYVSVFGEPVMVNEKECEVAFIDRKHGMMCPISKVDLEGNPQRVVAGVKNCNVAWIS